MQLIAGSTDAHLWADNFDREYKDILAPHSDVAQAIAREVKATVSPEEAAALVKSGTENRGRPTRLPDFQRRPKPNPAAKPRERVGRPRFITKSDQLKPISKDSSDKELAVSDRKNIFAKEYEIPIMLGKSSQAVPRIGSPRHKPVMQFDDDNHRTLYPLIVALKEARLASFDVYFYKQ